jgi:phosphoribosyl 1,2-cyclic phosphate phosphodiesterase
MTIEVLGSGGAAVTPKALCKCKACEEARKYGKHYTRLGPSVFIHGPNILIDTPEEIAVQLNRSNINDIQACLFSHWHPDHTAGKRIFEIGKDWIGYPQKNTSIDIYLTKTLVETFSRYLGIMGHLEYMESQGVIKISVIEDDGKLQIGKYVINPIKLGFDYVFGYEITGENKKMLIIMDELKTWVPSDGILSTRYDLIYLPFGIFEVNPFTNERNINKNNPLLETEQTIGETLNYVRMLNAKLFVLSHIEESDHITISLCKKLESLYSKITNKNIKIAFDTMKIKI